ncbi:MAG: hypothetical protein HY928_05925 [Elusimicrobia bacterium]|nr:hypothetical protein [Elusimicrobiota bacterium]
MTVLAAALALAIPAGAQGFSEGMTVEDMASGLKEAESLLKQKEGALKRAGILLPSASVAGETARVADLAESVRDGRPPKAPPADERLGFGSRAPGAALDQLAGSPGAKARRPGDVPAGPLNAERPLTDDELMSLRIDRIAEKKVHTETAREAFKRMLWTAYKAPVGAGSTDEVKGLLAFLKAQLDEKVEGADIWPLYWDSEMAPNILATYSGVIKVGPSFSKLGPLGKMTVLFHEMMHGHDDGGDHSAIEVNRMSGKYDYSPKHPVPAMQNAAEMLAYTDMAKWVEAL